MLLLLLWWCNVKKSGYKITNFSLFGPDELQSACVRANERTSGRAQPKPALSPPLLPAGRLWRFDVGGRAQAHCGPESHSRTGGHKESAREILRDRERARETLGEREFNATASRRRNKTAAAPLQRLRTVKGLGGAGRRTRG